jgi:hypothetical protein
MVGPPKRPPSRNPRRVLPESARVGDPRLEVSKSWGAGERQHKSVVVAPDADPEQRPAGRLSCERIGSAVGRGDRHRHALLLEPGGEGRADARV